jgi:chromosome segregation ATPase
MTDGRPSIRALAVSALLLASTTSCTVMQLKKGVEADELRIANKEEELKTEEARQASLQEQIASLRKDLETRQVTTQDLQSRLAQLQQANASMRARTQEQQALKRRREIKLTMHQKELADIQQSDTSIEEKKKKLEHLKEEIRKSLNLLVHS